VTEVRIIHFYGDINVVIHCHNITNTFNFNKYTGALLQKLSHLDTVDLQYKTVYIIHKVLQLALLAESIAS